MEQPEDILKEYWGYDSFRPGQLDIIQSVLSGHDTLGLLATGGGKSITFQVPALIFEGLTIVVTPLISLMKDQVDNLRDRDIRATYLYSGQTRREVTLAYDKCRLAKVKMLYVSPERLRSPMFLAESKNWGVSFIVVDEAHCISQWGYDFRPSYLRIAELREIFPDVPVLALTASATPAVRDDIVKQLNFRDGYNVFARTFARDNLSYIVRHTADKETKLHEVLAKTSGSAIVYVRSRVRTKQIATFLRSVNINADFYHAGLSVEDKSEKQNRWKSGETRVMVATNAFGMGIDKPDVRVVVHMDLPPSLEEYYQEAGRAGRDGLHSFAVIVASNYDKATLTRRLSDAFPEISYIRRVYELVCNFLDVPIGEGYNQVYEFDMDKFCMTFKLQSRQVIGALSLLGQAGYLEYVEQQDARGRVMFLARRDELYSLNLPPDVDAVMLALLRVYTGLFSEYVYINESYVAKCAGVDDETAYQALLTLSRMHVIHYVPKRLLPYIYLTTSREEPRYVNIPKVVYEERRAMMKMRLDAMREFTFGTSRCRSQVLLDYFGEKNSEPCGRCDLCREVFKPRPATSDIDYIDQAIIRIASHRGGSTVQELAADIRGTSSTIISRIRHLAEVHKIHLDGHHVTVPQK
jgi:ATP-dependent DNA helicase RecQ